MYVDETSSGAPADGWAVDPSQVQAFADAVAEVRGQLDFIMRQVQDLAAPDYAPMLGTSPVGEELAQKLVDRLDSERGLRGQLSMAVAHMEEFVLAAEHTAASYLQSDTDGAHSYRYG